MSWMQIFVLIAVYFVGVHATAAMSNVCGLKASGMRNVMFGVISAFFAYVVMFGMK